MSCISRDCYLELPAIVPLPKLSVWVLVTDGERVEVVGVDRL